MNAYRIMIMAINKTTLWIAARVPFLPLIAGVPGHGVIAQQFFKNSL